MVNLLWWAPTHRGTWTFYHVVFQDHLTNENLLYLHYQSAYGHRIWQNSNLHWRAHTHDEITWQTKSIITPIPQCIWPPNLVEWRALDHLIIWSCLITWQSKNGISLLLQYLWPPNLARAPLIKLLYPSITWIYRVTWHVKYLSPLTLDQWLPNMARWWFTVTGFHP